MKKSIIIFNVFVWLAITIISSIKGNNTPALAYLIISNIWISKLYNNLGDKN